ncbi:MAG: outer membrane protein assembly factor BamE [Gammaproteobacteria bacterium]
MSDIGSTSPRRRARRTLATVLPAICLVGVGACVYRVDVQQGNYLEPETIEEVEPGMTRSQVQFLLGTPMIADPFHANRWDYVYYFKPGKGRDVQSRRLTVYFEDDAVTRTENEADS